MTMESVFRIGYAEVREWGFRLIQGSEVIMVELNEHPECE